MRGMSVNGLRSDTLGRIFLFVPTDETTSSGEEILIYDPSKDENKVNVVC